MPEYIEAREQEDKYEGRRLEQLERRTEVLAPYELEAHHLTDHLFPACDGSCYERRGHECNFCKQAADQAADDRVREQGY